MQSYFVRGDDFVQIDTNILISPIKKGMKLIHPFIILKIKNYSFINLSVSLIVFEDSLTIYIPDGRLGMSISNRLSLTLVW